MENVELEAKYKRTVKLFALSAVLNFILAIALTVFITLDFNDNRENTFKSNTINSSTAAATVTNQTAGQNVLKTGTIVKAYWLNDPDLPTGIKHENISAPLLIAVKEWNSQSDYKQLGEFSKNAGNKFILRAKGQKDITGSVVGTTSTGDGSFQGYYIGFSTTERDKLVKGVQYSIVPPSISEDFVWKTEGEVKVVVPNE